MSGLSRIIEFKEVADKICGITRRYSLPLDGYRSPELPLYCSLPPQKQEEVLSQLRVFLKTLEAVETMGDRVDHNERSVWHAFSTMRLVPSSDAFSRISPDCVFEIYDLQGIQLWRNFSFLKICSYTLEEMHAIEWPSRYKRSEEKNAECLSKVGASLSENTPDVYFADISEHILEETSSIHRYILEARHDWIGRLKDPSGNLAAWFVTSQVKILGRRAEAAPARPKLSLVPSDPSDRSPDPTAP